MNAIEKAREARAEQALEKLIRHNGKIMTKKEFIEDLINNGYKPEESEKNRVQFDRRKFNRMTNYWEQEEYERKCNEKVKCFIIKNSEGCYYEISKAEFNYALSCTR
jgi:hypothetical protein